MAKYPETIKEDLSHVRWICGSPFGAKTSIANILESQLGYFTYHMDAHIHEHRANADDVVHPLVCEHKALTNKIKEKYGFIFRTPLEALKPWWMSYYHSDFEFVLDDLKPYSKDKTVIVEGVTLPELILRVSKIENIVYLVASEDFAEQIWYQRLRNPDETTRPFIERYQAAKKKYPQESDSWDANALDDAYWMADLILESAKKHGIKTIINDGSKSIDELTEMVREHFGL